jgi:hypothetical protein
MPPRCLPACLNEATNCTGLGTWYNPAELQALQQQLQSAKNTALNPWLPARQAERAKMPSGAGARKHAPAQAPAQPPASSPPSQEPRGARLTGAAGAPTPARAGAARRPRRAPQRRR